MPGQRASLMKDIHMLLAQDAALTPIDHVEDVLTAGYAHALSLEAKQLRFERELWQLARERDAASDDAATAEELNQRLCDVEYELAHLRGMLVTLRDRARELRAA